MILYIESRSTDPSYNLALEQFVFESLDRRKSYFMLWQNFNSVIVGKNQNTAAEINTAYISEKNISVVRRLSGGGAVYHDLGNINYTFIAGAEKGGAIDFEGFCRPVRDALVSFGVPAEITGRNDMTVNGKKVSGSAQYVRQGRVMHHGTLLYDSDLDALSKALSPAADKIESKGIKSVKSRVANIRPFMKADMTAGEFLAALRNYFFASFEMEEYVLAPEEEAGVEKLRGQAYSQWAWNYGASPPHNMRKARSVPGCGNIEVLLDVEKGGRIKNIAFFGDFFGNDDPSVLAAILKGRFLEYGEIKAALGGADLSRFFHSLDAGAFLSLLFGQGVFTQ